MVAHPEARTTGSVPYGHEEDTRSCVWRPVFAGGLRKGQDHPHACLNGYVYLGYVVEEDGEEVERIEALPCRRCASEAGR